MKKIKWLVLLCVTISLSACQVNEKKEITDDRQTTESTTEGESEKMNQTMTYAGELTENAEVGENNVRLTFKEVKTEDGKDTMDSISSDGVILNADLNTIKQGENPKDWTAGTKIKFTVQEPVIMTRSIPPQIPGSVIKKVEVEK